MSDVPSDQVYIQTTPAGAYYTTCTKKDDASRRLLQQFLCSPTTPNLDIENLSQQLSLTNDATLELLQHLDKLKFLQRFDEPMQVDTGKLEDILPQLLQALSCENKALLADEQGFYISSAGFPHETAEELSALGADLASLHERHSGLLLGNLNMQSNSWALVDAAGFSQLGFWPLFVGVEVFTLIISGVPRLDRNEFLRLVWALHTRYAAVHSKVNFRAVTV